MQRTLEGTEADLQHKRRKPVKKVPRKQRVLDALKELGGTATTRQVAEKCGLNVNGVSQTLSSISGTYLTGEGEAGDRVWALVKSSETNQEEGVL